MFPTKRKPGSANPLRIFGSIVSGTSSPGVSRQLFRKKIQKHKVRSICIPKRVKVASHLQTEKIALNEKLVAIEVHPKAAEIAKARKTLDLCEPDRPVKRDMQFNI